MLRWLANGSGPRRRQFPLRIVCKREDLLSLLGTVDLFFHQHFESRLEPIKARILQLVGANAAVDAVKDRGQVEHTRSRFKKILIEDLCSRHRSHDTFSFANFRRVSSITISFRLPERKPPKSSVTYRKP